MEEKSYPTFENRPNPPSYDNINQQSYAQQPSAVPMPMPMPTVQQQQQPPQIVVVNTQPQYGGTGFHSRPAVITQQPHSTVVIHPVPLLGIYPQAANCPQCRSNITTSVTYEPSCKTHFFAGLICLLGCWLGCCLIPYCVDSCQAATHKCPSCGAYLGKTD